MSLLWSEPVRIGLSPRRVELARLRPGLRRHAVVGENARDCVPEDGQPMWTGALEALDALLADRTPGGGGATVVLSNHFVRYAVLPWNPELVTAAEFAVAAAQRIQLTYGDAARGWEVRASAAEWGQAGIVCAIDAALLAALAEHVGRAGLRLVSVEPLLMKAFNTLRRDLAADGALAVVEAGRVCVGVFSQGQWLSVMSRRCDGADPARLIAQELALAAPETPPGRVELLNLGPDRAWAPSPELPLRPHATPGGHSCRLALYGSV